MVSFKILSKYFLPVISLLFSLTLNAQTVNEVVEFADEQFKLGNFVTASKEYNRAFFFGYEPKDELSIKIAHCYANNGQHQMAGDFYDRAYRFAGSDSMRNEAILGKAFGYIVQKNFLLAINELLNISDSSTTSQQLHYHFLKGIAHFGAKHDSLSYTEFLAAAYLSEADSNDVNALMNEFENVFTYDDRFKPRRAYILSGIIPGSGQMSVGAYREGINSFLLVGGLYALSIRVMILYSFWDAVVALFPWIHRYYLGGMDRARDLAHKRIDDERAISYQKIVELTAPHNF